MEIDNFTFKSDKTGVKLLVFGAIHGNETCGTVAISKVISEINSGVIKLIFGQVTFVPICNKAAYDANIRYIDRDLNRCIYPHKNPITNEQQIANILCTIIEKHDVLLDIHSMTSKSDPSTFEGGNSSNEEKLLDSLNVKTIFTHWNEKYKGTDKSPTTSFAGEKGLAAATLECGQHKDIEAPIVAYENILNVLSAFNMIEYEILPFKKPSRIKLYDTVKKEEGSTFIKKWKNLSPVKKGEVIGTNGDKKFVSPINGFIIMPSIQAKVGGEWYYLGTN